MAQGLQIRVEGLKKLGAVFHRAADVELPKKLRKANVSAAELIAEGARRGAPKGETGKLSGSIRPIGNQRSASVRVGGARVPYAAAVHWGTGPRPGLRGPHNIRRNAFMVRSLDEFRGAAVEMYELRIAELVKEIG